MGNAINSRRSSTTGSHNLPPPARDRINDLRSRDSLSLPDNAGRPIVINARASRGRANHR